MKYYIYTYGCQMNEHESEKIAGIFEKLGYEKGDAAEKADVIAFNTCCVRENAERHAYGNIGALKQLKKARPEIVIAVGGCMTQQPGAAEKLRRTFPFVDVVFGTHNLPELGNMIMRRLETNKKVVEIAEGSAVSEGVPAVRNTYPNAWVNVMYGCNNFCTYCIVPYVRGREKSRASKDVIGEVRSLIGEGYKEITLLGQNVNSYGKDLEENTDFADLIDEICRIDGKFRLRFMSNHPKDFNEKMIKVIAKNNKVCNSVHLPLQAGSDRILKLMNRRYTAAEYLEKVRLLRKYVPDCALTSDVMVGFPTETEEDFQDTMRVVREAGYIGAFTFVYSRRTGTVADKMDGQVSDELKKDRIMRLVDLQNSLSREQSAGYEGKAVEVLCEDYDEKKNTYLGRDQYGKMCYFKCEKNLLGKFVTVKIADCSGISLYGNVINAE
ncbi:MAG: tRNA (N6-isopentenyl adenosine(37)-C2)-methylthiotransferase MiaB [Clostridia bacterium]|nr:tRNA (N6-isopentenyl adenosine(37)-C2)-methylthiotransferase MiaB [Clostridia bacterium]